MDEETASEDLPFGVEMTRLGADTNVQPPLESPSLMLQGDGSSLDIVALAASFRTDGSATPECDRLVDLARAGRPPH